jgi:hypothetical protein
VTIGILALEVNRDGAGTTEKKVVQLHNGPVGSAIWEKDWPEGSGRPAGEQEDRRRLREGEELLEPVGYQADWQTEKKGGPGSGFLGEEVNARCAQLGASGEEHGGNGVRRYCKAVNISLLI